MYHNHFLALKLAASNTADSIGFRVILDDEFEYGQAREISNAYYDKKPDAVAYPRTAAHIKTCITYCKENSHEFRVRSGGHQHEGMSSLDEGLVIRLSDMSLIEYEGENVAWINAGMKLGTVYDELAHNNKIIPAGGCFTVNVGGLALGGGWGMHSRIHGLTCDSLLAVELITASGDLLEVTAQSDSKLFKALCGGGQGNFGIVTRLKFQLKEIGSNLTLFRFGWNAQDRKKVAKAWLDIQDQFPDQLTSFVRMSVTDPSINQANTKARECSIYGGGLFYGTEEELRELEGIKALLKTEPAVKEWVVIKKDEDGLLNDGTAEEKLSIADLFGYDDFTMGFSVPDLLTAAPNAEEKPCIVAPPAANCNVPHPHKVSSAFPRGSGESYHADIAVAIASYLDDSEFDPNVRSYMTFHAMGGAIKKEPKAGRAFPYKDKEFLLQFQSWWNYPEDKTSKEGKACMAKVKEREVTYIKWVTDFRKELEDKQLVEGAFINFVDKDLVADYKTPEGKLALLKYYFAHNLDELRETKKRLDPENQFNFEMSIPPK